MHSGFEVTPGPVDQRHVREAFQILRRGHPANSPAEDDDLRGCHCCCQKTERAPCQSKARKALMLLLSSAHVMHYSWLKLPTAVSYITLIMDKDCLP